MMVRIRPFIYNLSEYCANLTLDITDCVDQIQVILFRTGNEAV
jgi:hypothetical protein